MSEAWKQIWLPETRRDMASLHPRIRLQVVAAVDKVAQNPLPATEGGYGKPLRNGATKLAGLCKIKLREAGVRVVYKTVRTDRGMIIVIVGVRADDEVYRQAEQRRLKHGL